VLQGIFAGQSNLQSRKECVANLKRTIRREILRKLKAKEKETFYNSLPMDREIFQELLDHLEGNLEDGCDHSMMLTIEFLEIKKFNKAILISSWTLMI
jgi:hypothetical protein